MKLHRFSSTLSAFRKGDSGTVALIFGLAAIPLVLAVGSAIDYSRSSTVENMLQVALDGAVLAVARSEGKPEQQRIALGTQHFAQNFTAPEGMDAIRPRFVFTADRIEGSVEGSVPTTFMRVAAITGVPIGATSDAMRPVAGNAEIVMVLDYSGSMNDDSKYTRMATVAQDFITTMASDLSALSSLKFGVVPFSDVVSVDMPASEWSVPVAGMECTQDRVRPYTIQDAGWDGSLASKWALPHTINGAPFDPADCVDFRSKGLDTIPLGTNYAAIKTSIAAMQPFRDTHISLGAEMGWHLLSPAIPYTEAGSYAASNVHKFIVILTDGMQTSPGYGPGGTLDDPAGDDMVFAEQNLLDTCTAMKDKGVTVFTIGYDLDPADPDPDIARSLANLTACATPGKYYNADVAGADLENTFADIAHAVKESMIYLAR